MRDGHLDRALAQVNAVVPQSVASDGTVEVVAVFDGKVSASVTLPVTAADPALFTHDGTGRGQSAALNQDGTVNFIPEGEIIWVWLL